MQTNMSETECPASATQTARCCFKGVENFLKRVAFNLGNSPSQTEVKIISCIPIDVSDLQQKIIYLEKQLEETRRFRVTNPQKPVINTAICEYPLLSNTGVYCNMLDMDRRTSPYKEPHPHGRFSSRKKSNISLYDEKCIADDRSDEKSCPDVPYDDYLNSFPLITSRSRECQKHFFKKKKKYFKYKKPKSNCVYYARTRSNPFNVTVNKVKAVSKNKQGKTRSYLADIINKHYKARPLGGNISEISSFSSPVCRDGTNFYESDLCSCLHEGFQNIDKYLTRDHNPYLHHSNNLLTERRYYDSTLYDMVPVKEKPIKMQRNADFTKIKELEAFVDSKNSSEDILTKLRPHPVHNPLHDNSYTLLPKTKNNLRKVTKVYIREPIPVTKSFDKRKNKLPNVDRKINILESKSCSIDFREVPQIQVVNKKSKEDKCLNPIRIPHKRDAECLTTTIVTNNDCQTGKSIDEPNTDHKREKTLNDIKTILKSVLQEVKVTGVPQCSTDDKKGINAPNSFQNNTQNSKYSNAPNIITENKIGNLQGNVPYDIKNNMPACNSLLRNMVGNQPGFVPCTFSDATPTNMQVPGYLQESRLLNSFSSYNTNQYMPSCSKQSNSNVNCYLPPTIYYQNYPLFTHNPERHVCASCYRRNSYLKCNGHKQATTIATNTDHVTEKPEKETHKLVKEIFKSMALNMTDNKARSVVNITEKCTNNPNYVETSKKTVEKKPHSMKEIKKATNEQGVSEIFRKKVTQVSSESRNKTTAKTQESFEVSTCSQILTNTDVNSRLKKAKERNLLNKSKLNTYEDSLKEEAKFNRRTAQDSGTVTTSETEKTTNETDTEDITIEKPQTKRNQGSRQNVKGVGLLSKIFKFVKCFQQKNKKSDSFETQNSEKTSSDTDDYQTIYSHRIIRPVKPRSIVCRFPRRRTHSKIPYKQAYHIDRSAANVIRRLPYMEQEYRREWNERLMFCSNSYGQSSGRPTNSYEYISKTKKPPFCKICEVRTAILHPNKNAINNKRARTMKKIEPKTASEGIALLKNHKLGLEFNREHWKNIVVIH